MNMYKYPGYRKESARQIQYSGNNFKDREQNLGLASSEVYDGDDEEDGVESEEG